MDNDNVENGKWRREDVDGTLGKNLLLVLLKIWS